MIIRAGRPALLFGPVAQLGERTVRIRKVVGSNPFRSTKTTKSELVPNQGWVRICLLSGRYHLTQKVIPPRDDLLLSDIENI